MKEKGFTLIELLAVIVILAIIALIATPIVLNIIKDAKKKSAEISVENYFSAIEQAIVKRNLNGEFKPTVCTVISQGLDCEGYDEPLKVEVDGETPTSGAIYFSNGKASNGTILNFDSYTKKINNLAQENVKSVTDKTKTTGLVPIQEENGNIKPGSEFKIKVNSNSDWLTFFVLSNSEDGKYVNLIAEQNIASDGTFTREPQDGDEWNVITNYNSYNRTGPQNAYKYLSKATSNWINIPIIENLNYLDEGNQRDSSYGYQSIITSLNKEKSKYITTITPLSSNYGNPVMFEGMRARLPKYSEVNSTEVGCNSSVGSCPIWMVNYLSSDSRYEQYYNDANGKISSVGYNKGYYTLSSLPDYVLNVYCIHFNGIAASDTYISDVFGVRPVITILKSDLLRVME